MNTPFAPACAGATTVAVANLHDDAVADRIAAFVEDRHGSPFHLPEWLIAVERGTGQRTCGLVAERAPAGCL